MFSNGELGGAFIFVAPILCLLAAVFAFGVFIGWVL